MEHEGLQAELFIGGVYLTLFMKNPQFPLRNPKASLEVAVLLIGKLSGSLSGRT